MSTGISGRPQVKIRTQAAVLRPTPGSAGQELERLLAGRRPRSSRGRGGRRARGGSPGSAAPSVGEPARADRLLDLVERRVADLLPGREALAQAGVGDVAVAVVGVLGEHGLDQLGDRMAVRLVDRAPVELAQPVADRPHPPLRRPLPALCSWPRHIRRRRRCRSDQPSSTRLQSRNCPCLASSTASAAGCPRAGATCCARSSCSSAAYNVLRARPRDRRSAPRATRSPTATR